MKKIWQYITTGLAIVLGIVLYLLKRKNEQLAGYKAKLSLVITQNQADMLESEIKEKLNEEKLLIKEREDFEKLLIELKEKRDSLSSSNLNFEDYWNNK